MLKIKVLKILDRIIGSAIVGLMGHPKVKDMDQSPASILIIRPGGIGDAVLLLPVIMALRANYPGARITVLAESRNGAIFSLCPAVDELLYYDRLRDLLKAVQGTYDMAIDTEQWHRLSAVVARLTGAPVTVGFGTNDRRRLFTFAVPYSHEDYEAASFYRLVSPLGIVMPRSMGPFITIPRESAASAVQKLKNFAVSSYFVIFPGASIAERRWGWEHYRAVAESVMRHCDIAVVVVGGTEDEDEGAKIIDGLHGLNLAGKTSLAETAAVIEQGLLLVSGDSGILHLGVALDKPTVSLFGPGIAAKWAPAGNKHIVINRQLACSPCTSYGTTPQCIAGAICMAEITAEEVVLAVSRLLNYCGRGQGWEKSV